MAAEIIPPNSHSPFHNTTMAPMISAHNMPLKADRGLFKQQFAFITITNVAKSQSTDHQRYGLIIATPIEGTMVINTAMAAICSNVASNIFDTEAAVSAAKTLAPSQILRLRVDFNTGQRYLHRRSYPPYSSLSARHLHELHPPHHRW